MSVFVARGCGFENDFGLSERSLQDSMRRGIDALCEV